jgi:hypothetical protein
VTEHSDSQQNARNIRQQARNVTQQTQNLDQQDANIETVESTAGMPKLIQDLTREVAGLRSSFRRSKVERIALWVVVAAMILLGTAYYVDVLGRRVAARQQTRDLACLIVSFFPPGHAEVLDKIRLDYRCPPYTPHGSPSTPSAKPGAGGVGPAGAAVIGPGPTRTVTATARATRTAPGPTRTVRVPLPGPTQTVTFVPAARTVTVTTRPPCLLPICI